MIAAAAVIVQAGFGSFYAWSVFRGPLSEVYGVGVARVNAAFILANLLSGVAAFGGGLLIRRAGARAVGVFGGVLYGGAVFCAGLFGGSLSALYLAYALAGVGLGLGYVAPVAALPRWFPDKPGLAYGLSVLGFGAGPVVGAPLALALISWTGGPLSAFAVLGPAYAAAIGGAALLLKNPPGYREPITRAEPSDGGPGWGFGRALRTWQLYALWVMFLVNTTAGLAILSDASSMAVGIGGATAALASAFVVVLAVADTTGRLVWPALSDRIGRENVFLAMFLLQAAAFFLIPLLARGTGSSVAFVALSALVLTCYGGGYATVGAIVDDYHGSGDVGTIYGSMVTAAGVAGLGAPVGLALSVDGTGSYAPALYATSALMLVGCAIPLALKPPRPCLIPHDDCSPTGAWATHRAHESPRGTRAEGDLAWREPGSRKGRNPIRTRPWPPLRIPVARAAKLFRAIVGPSRPPGTDLEGPSRPSRGPPPDGPVPVAYCARTRSVGRESHAR